MLLKILFAPIFKKQSRFRKTFCNLPNSFFWSFSRSSHRRWSIKKLFIIFTGRHLCWSLFIKVADLKTPTHVFSCEYRNIHRKTPVLKSLFNKVAGLKACNFIKKRLQRRCFPANIAKFLRTAILKNINKRMPLNLNKNFNQILHK